MSRFYGSLCMSSPSLMKFVSRSTNPCKPSGECPSP